MRQNFPDALLVIGAVAVVAGCALIAVPLGLVVGGLLLVALGFAVGGE